jgi:RNA-directed DNA polymerase
VGELKSPGKSFEISKLGVWEAYRKVRANRGAPGVDEVSLAEFEKDLKGNLYKIWNRMSSGTYFPPPVRAVEIPKGHGKGVRVLGVPTVGDRVAQTVVAGVLEERAERIFHRDSYGYRPGRGALDAVAACRERCWRYDWVVEFDIRSFFDSVPWELVMKAVGSVCDLPWVLLYVRRWLAAPLRQADGSLTERHRGTPQGSAVSPVLANLFLHWAFDAWMSRAFPGVPFERYADDGVIHCRDSAEAGRILAALTVRMAEVGLELHPDKTRVVYCQDGRRRGEHPHTSFTFLGFEFRQRRVRTGSGEMFSGFNPAASKDLSESDIARWINPVVRGWMQYYGAFYRSELYPLLGRINSYLMRWMRKKYKRLRKRKKAHRAWERAVTSRPRFFAHWAWIPSVPRVW